LNKILNYLLFQKMRSSKYKGQLSAALTASCTCLIRSCKCRHCHHSEFAQLRAWLLVYCCLLKVIFCYCSHCSLPMVQQLLSLSPLPLCCLLCHDAANSSTVVVCCHHHRLPVDCCFFSNFDIAVAAPFLMLLLLFVSLPLPLTVHSFSNAA